MKPGISIVLLSICLQLAYTHPASAQKFIKIDDQLREHSQPMTVKRKGFNAVGKWEFGSYKVIYGESGWKTGTESSPLFGGHTSASSSVKKSFVLVNNADTCTANIRVLENIETDEGSWFWRTFVNPDQLRVEKGEAVFETEFALSTDTAIWRLLVIYPIAVEAEGTVIHDNITRFRGMLTDQHTSIEIKEVNINEEGKRPLLNPVLGYEFLRGSESLAAVQVMPSNRMYIWLRDDLDNSLKFVLANAAVAMLVKTY